ncbi:SAM-dependent methyltransferase [Mycolicibacterium sp. 018/SC-01/001]|uniref:SAM-dependent methyltransferase n=1 Tax=Mycolicibacterium sp. 018/SC-01/001 TaxID=2592069 RepID=UPI00118143E8|nr:SAM-dependent methyltransferase [Mycolicibacterium sp. 018/SC-01/001]TRW88286.1 SAM-dependent methyltransferase [Mycolicibacterium sp. 018/SC-01/001]
MPESSIVVRPEPVDSGTYTAGSRLQAAGLARATEIFSEAAAAVPLPTPPQPIVLADYGAATGYNSLVPMGAAISVLRKRTRPEHAVLVAHTDRPDNDFTALFRTLDEDPDTYLTKDRAAFASAVGRSFYGQILPSNSVNLGWSAWAIHWLSQVPAPVLGAHLQVATCGDEELQEAYAKQAARDWHEFVAFRGRELCPGGRLVVTTMGIGDDGEVGFRPLLAAMADALAEVTAAGVITADEAAHMCIPTVARRAADFTAPFAPSGVFERLQIEHLEIVDAQDRFWERYQSDGDAAEFGSRWAGFARASIFAALTSALEHGLADPRAADVHDRLEKGIAERLAAAPERTQIPLAFVVLEKRR